MANTKGKETKGKVRGDGWRDGLPVTKAALEEFRLRTVIDTYAAVLEWTNNGTSPMDDCADPDQGGYTPLAEALHVPVGMLKLETERHVNSEHVTVEELNELLEARTAWQIIVDRWGDWNATNNATIRRGQAKAAKVAEA